MNLLLSCVGKRGYIARLFREHLRPGDRIIGTSNTAWTPGFHACDAGVVMPDIDHPSYPDAVLQLCRRERIDALLSFFDPDVHRLSRMRDDLQALGVKAFVPGPAAADVSFDKLRTASFLRDLGIATPRTVASLAEAREALRNGELRFPLFVKPRCGFGSRNTFEARDLRQLEAFWSLEPDMIVQQKLGGDAYDFDILNDCDGRVLSVVPWRKLMSRMGETEQAETVESPMLLDLGVRLATALGHAGPLDADLFVEDGVASVLEINLRFGGGYPVSHLAGADFPGKLLRLARGETVEPTVGRYRRGVVMTKELHVLGGPRESFFQDVLHLRDPAQPGAAPVPIALPTVA
jgi:carbamoyl-phosphate synthase large subunit